MQGTVWEGQANMQTTHQTTQETNIYPYPVVINDDPLGFDVKSIVIEITKHSYNTSSGSLPTMAVVLFAPSTTVVLLILLVFVTQVAVNPTMPFSKTGFHVTWTDIVWGHPWVDSETWTLLGAVGRTGFTGFSSFSAASTVADVFWDIPDVSELRTAVEAFWSWPVRDEASVLPGYVTLPVATTLPGSNVRITQLPPGSRPKILLHT